MANANLPLKKSQFGHELTGLAQLHQWILKRKVIQLIQLQMQERKVHLSLGQVLPGQGLLLFQLEMRMLKLSGKSYRRDLN